MFELLCKTLIFPINTGLYILHMPMTDTLSDRQTGRQTDRQADRKKDRQVGRQAGRQTHKTPT